jgi:hypothetical protein
LVCTNTVSAWAASPWARSFSPARLAKAITAARSSASSLTAPPKLRDTITCWRGGATHSSGRQERPRSSRGLTIIETIM